MKLSIIQIVEKNSAKRDWISEMNLGSLRNDLIDIAEEVVSPFQRRSYCQATKDLVYGSLSKKKTR